MALCSFRNCPLKRNPKGTISYYPFPSSPELFTKWVASVNRPDWLPSKNDYICHYHFPKASFFDNMLKEDAVPHATPPSKNTADSDQIDLKTPLDKSPLKKSKFSQTCRLCGKSDDKDMKDIYDNKLQILEKISLCLPILVLPNDTLPKKICTGCQGQLDICFTLVQVTLATEEKLKKFIEFQKNKLERKKELNKIKRSGIIRLQLRGPIDCDLCGVHFLDMNMFDDHMKQHEDDTPVPRPNDSLIITCNECGYLYKEKQEYEHHKVKRSVKCKKCNTYSESYCASRSHECPRKYCFVCRKQFQRKKKFAAHMERVHNIKIDLTSQGTECSNCHTVHDMPDEVRVHNCEEHQTMEGECNLCNQMKSLCPPMKILKTPWICKYCGKCMTTKLSLDIHERIHSGAKPYMCEWCGNEFRSKSNLLQHHLTHTGVRKHSCAVCGKKFSRKSFVRSHMRVHTGERPFQCDVCRQRFTQVGDMRRHRNRHHSLSDNGGGGSANKNNDYLPIEMDFLQEDSQNVDEELKAEEDKLYLNTISERNV